MTCLYTLVCLFPPNVEAGLGKGLTLQARPLGLAARATCLPLDRLHLPFEGPCGSLS